MQLLDEYFQLQRKIYEHFGYVEDWVVIPLDDKTESYWRLEGDGPGEVWWADSEGELETGDGNCHCGSIYTQRFLPKWVYRASDYTMVCVDTHTDGNRFLMIFDNSKKRPHPRRP